MTDCRQHDIADNAYSWRIGALLIRVSTRWGIAILTVLLRSRSRMHESEGDEGADAKEHGLECHDGIEAVQDRGQGDGGEEGGPRDVGRRCEQRTPPARQESPGPQCEQPERGDHRPLDNSEEHECEHRLAGVPSTHDCCDEKYYRRRGAEAVADRRQHDIDDHVLSSGLGEALVDSVPGPGGGGGAGVQVEVGSTEGSRGRAVSHSGATRVARGSA